MTFEQALELTDSIGGRAAYEIEALRGLWTALSLLKPYSAIIEVGCEYGRSTSLIMQAARERQHRVILIDPFIGADPAGVSMTDVKAYQSLTGMLWRIGYPFTLHACRFSAAVELPERLDMVHIDGDHRWLGIKRDCELLLPRLRHGGIAVWHDYGHDSLPDVKPVVDEFTKSWEVTGTWHTCRVMRKP